MRNSTKKSWWCPDSWEYQTAEVATCAVSKQWDFHKNSEFYICWSDICDWRSIELRNIICARNIKQFYVVKFTIYKVNLIQSTAELLRKVVH